MRKYILYIIVLVAVLTVGMVISSKNAPQKEVKDDTQEAKEAWISVLSPKVFELQTDEKTVIRELATGDSVSAGMVIRTEVDGRAEIYFPDGSVLRINKGSMVKIEEASFDSGTDSLRVGVTLLAGKVWSKIIELATPDSYWEVKTSNAVATVRGSAFGMEFDAKKKSRIIGSEHDIAVSIIDPVTKERIKSSEAIVSENKILEIEDKIVAEVIALAKTEASVGVAATMKENVQERMKILMNVADAPKEVTSDVWVKESEAKDALLRERMDTMQKEGLSGRELRLKLRQEVFQEFREDIIRMRLEGALEEKETSTEVPVREPLNVQEEVREVIKETISVPVLNTRTETVVPIVKALPVSLEVVTKASPKLSEGVTVYFEAVAVLSDGTRQNVTDRVSWKVVGPIGKILKPGVFYGELSPEVAEQGTAVGAVAAILTLEAGDSLLGKSSILTVDAVVSDDSSQIGGQ